MALVWAGQDTEGSGEGLRWRQTGISKQDSMLNGGLGVTEELAEGRVYGQRLEKKAMDRVLWVQRGTPRGGTLTFVCNLASCFSSRLVCL